MITHGHADHARAGHGMVAATAPTLAIMGVRYGEGFAGKAQALAPYEDAATLADDLGLFLVLCEAT